LSGVGAGPDVIAGYITQVKNYLTSAKITAPVGHVDTWTAWVNASNNAVIDACDFIGMDAYPYFQTTMANSIENGNAIFWDAYEATKGAVGKKFVWITENCFVQNSCQSLALELFVSATHVQIERFKKSYS
jgi:glucan endo-1,3-beta-D-glucosidase